MSMEFLVSAFLLFRLLQKILTVSKSFDFFGKILFTYKTVTKNLFGQKLCNFFRLKHFIFGENQNFMFVVFHQQDSKWIQMRLFSFKWNYFDNENINKYWQFDWRNCKWENIRQNINDQLDSFLTTTNSQQRFGNSGK